MNWNYFYSTWIIYFISDEIIKRGYSIRETVPGLFHHQFRVVKGGVDYKLSVICRTGWDGCELFRYNDKVSEKCSDIWFE
jgi:hypothetical protein